MIENSEFSLVIGADAVVRSLVHKPSGEECLIPGVKVAAFSITQYRPYDNELQLSYPAKSKTFPAKSVVRKGDTLVVEFELLSHIATIGLKVSDSYIGFSLDKLDYHIEDYGIKRVTAVDEFTILQLPVKDRANFGDWLNVVWDNNVAINLLQTIDRNIEYALQGGFRMMVIYWSDFAEGAGHFKWRKEFPGGMDDLKQIVDKIKGAGMIPGLHMHYCKASVTDAYVTPVPDHRLNLRRMFTLAAALGSSSDIVMVEENPADCTMDDRRRFLKIGNERITYAGYTAKPPYQFYGCQRAALGSTAGSFELQECEQIPDAAQGSPGMRAFIFDRKGTSWVVYWHPFGAAQAELQVNTEKIKVYQRLGTLLPIEKKEGAVVIPVDDRHYIEADLPRKELIAIIQAARML